MCANYRFMTCQFSFKELGFPNDDDNDGDDDDDDDDDKKIKSIS